ncbi:MAG: hypothetical protein AB1782_05120, partial [Cyanobacteriota bacterium]
PLDSDMDGRILSEIFTEQYLSFVEEVYFEEEKEYNNSNYKSLSESDESQIMDTLYEMGYL